MFIFYYNNTHIFLSVSEIVGAEGTPYSGGVFKLEIQIPDRYPHIVILLLTLSSMILLVHNTHKPFFITWFLVNWFWIKHCLNFGSPKCIVYRLFFCIISHIYITCS